MAVTLNANSSTGFIATSDTSGVLQLQTGGTTAVTVDASQNVGVGVTPSAWSGVKALQVGSGACLVDFGSSNAIFGSNFYNDGANKYINTDSASFYQQNNGAHAWASAASGTAGNAVSFTQAMTLNASGQLLLGTTSTDTGLSVDIQNVSPSSSNVLVQIKNTNVGEDAGLIISGYSGSQREYRIGVNTADNISDLTFSGPTGYRWYVGGSESARITSGGGGVFMVGATTAHSFGIPSIQAGGSNGDALISVRRNVTTTADQIIFYNPNGLVGRIETTGSATAFTTSSDYRLKENITPMTGALSKVALLKPVTYKWKVDGSDSQGFIAHELAEVCPQAVSGEKDAVNEDGSINPQGIDTSFLVATLTAAIQELKALVDTQASTITTLTDRITALEAK